MKRNLNSLKRLISEFHKTKRNAQSKEARLKFLDEILFFENKTENTPFINEKIQRKELINVRVAQLRTAARTYRPGSTFIRARKIDVVLRKPTIQDFWEPPPEFTKQFRLNQPGEAVLYVTCDTLTAKMETQIVPGDIYNLNFYQANEPIEVTEFAFPLQGKQKIIERTIETFFHELLSTPGANIYDVSNFIAKRYLDLSKDGWVYPSIANENKGVNLCLNAESKQKLSLIGAFSFCNGTPIASYDTTDQFKINTSTQSEAKSLWENFTKTSNAFGKITATHDPTPIFLVKPIHQLSQ